MGFKVSVDPGGGVGAGGFVASPEAVVAGGAVLEELARRSAQARRFRPVSGCGPYGSVAAAVADVVAVWEPALGRWEFSLESVGRVTRASGQQIARNDHERAASWTSMMGSLR